MAQQVSFLYGVHADTQARDGAGYRFTWAGHVPQGGVPASIKVTSTTVQQQPDHPQPFLRAGPQGPNVRAPGEDSLTTVQEQPWNPGAFVAPRFQPAAAAQQQAVSTPLLVAQENRAALAEGSSLTRPGVQGPNVAPPVTSRALTAQEQPTQPPAQWRAGIQGPNVRPPVRDSVSTVQEQPSHPGPTLWQGVQGPNVATGIRNWAITVQQAPDHPLPAFVRSFNRQDPVPPVTAWAITRIEQPYHPAPSTWPGIFVQAVVLPVQPERRAALTTQEQPAPLPAPIARPSKQGPDVARGLRDWIITAQEQPGHPLPQVARPHAFTPSVALAAERRQFITGFEQPDHPSPLLRAGKQGPDVASGIQALLTKAEEITGHPQPFLRSSIIVAIVPPGQRTSISTQEQPGHPSPYVLAGRSFTGPRTPERRAAITVLEQPRETPSMLLLGVHPAVTVSAIINHRRLIGTELQPALIGTRVPANLLGEVDQ